MGRLISRYDGQSFWHTGIDHWSEIRLDNASIVSKSEAGSRQPPPDSGAPLLYRFILQYGSFSCFLPWIRFWPGQFYNHKDRSIQEEFLAKTLEYYDFITPRNGIYNFEGLESHRLCLSTGARTLWTKAATLWTKAYWG